MPTSLEDVLELIFYVGENRGFLVAVGLCPAHTRLPTRWPVRTRRWRRACDRAVHGLECVREISRWHAGASQDSDLSRSSDWISVSTSDIPALRPTRMSAPGHPTPSRNFWLWRGLEVFLDRKRCFFSTNAWIFCFASTLVVFFLTQRSHKSSFGLSLRSIFTL